MASDKLLHFADFSVGEQELCEGEVARRGGGGQSFNPITSFPIVIIKTLHISSPAPAPALTSSAVSSCSHFTPPLTGHYLPFPL